ERGSGRTADTGIGFPDFDNLALAKGHERDFPGGLAIHPILDLVAVFHLPGLVARLAHGQQQLFAVHAFRRPLLLNGHPNGLGQLFHVVYRRTVLVEIEDWGEYLFNLGRLDGWHAALEDDGYVGTGGRVRVVSVLVDWHG